MFVNQGHIGSRPKRKAMDKGVGRQTGADKSSPRAPMEGPTHLSTYIVVMSHDVFAKRQLKEPATQNQSIATCSSSGESGIRRSHRYVRFDERISDGGDRGDVLRKGASGI